MKERPILFSGTRSPAAINGATPRSVDSVSLKSHVPGLSTLDGVHQGGMNGVVARAEFLRNLVPHCLHERVGAITLAFKQNRRLPYAWSRLKRRAIRDVCTFFDNSAIRHCNLRRRHLRGIVARCLRAMLVAPLDRPALRRLECVRVGGIVAEVTRILHLDGIATHRGAPVDLCAGIVVAPSSSGDALMWNSL